VFFYNNFNHLPAGAVTDITNPAGASPGVFIAMETWGWVRFVFTKGKKKPETSGFFNFHSA